MRILVTGCMGFIGSNVVPHLLAAGHAVTGYDNLSNPSLVPTDRMKQKAGNTWADFTFFMGDVCDVTGLLNILVNQKIEAVVHLAARGSVPLSFKSPAACVQSNELGFARLVECMHKTGVKKLVFASSSSVYGNSIKNVKVEGEEGAPLSPYALSKKQNEEFARIYCKAVGIAYVGLRFFNVYGPGQRPDSEFSAVIPKFIHKPPVINGDGSTMRDFTFVDDVAFAIERALAFTDANKDAAQILNVGTGAGTSLKGLAGMLGKEPKFGPAREGDVKISLASTMLAERTIGFKARTSLAEGLGITKDFFERFEHGKENAKETL